MKEVLWYQDDDYDVVVDYPLSTSFEKQTTFDNVFLQISVILRLASIVGMLAQRLRRPLIVAFIAVGILFGPSGFGTVAHSSEIERFARLGIALLLLVVGRGFLLATELHALTDDQHWDAQLKYYRDNLRLTGVYHHS